MNVTPKLDRDFDKVTSALGENLTDDEMENLLAERHEEIEGLLEEARQAKARGETEPLEPLHDFLRRARERLRPPESGAAIDALTPYSTVTDLARLRG